MTPMKEIIKQYQLVPRERDWKAMLCHIGIHKYIWYPETIVFCQRCGKKKK
jgi:hypothetical protein